LLNEMLFSTLAEARTKITAWKMDYNPIRPHSSLGNLTPKEFAMKTRLEMKAARGQNVPTDYPDKSREVRSQVKTNVRR
ncbi:MAG: integrase core domain-containing protein, partial [Pseudomonadota bacterium]